MKLRPVLPSDLEFLYALMNEPSVRAVSHNPKPFTFKEHKAYWQNKMLNDAKFEANIIEDNVPVGLIRRDNELISIAIMPEYQGKGYGTQALCEFCKLGDKAEIYVRNPVSLATFNKAGFSITMFTMEKGTNAEPFRTEIIR